MVGADGYASLARRNRRFVRLPVPLVADSFAAYEAERRRRGLLDLDDLLLEGARILQDDAGFAEALRWRFRHLYVDELQDVNPAQFRLVRLLCGDDPDLFCVGDPNQSIYGWNGADPDLLAQLPDVFPNTRVIRLDDNHRSSPAIVRLAAAALEVIDVPNSTRPDGPVPVIIRHKTDRDEAEWLAKEAWLSHPPGRRWSSIAVLARTNAQLRTVAQAFDRQRVPYSFASGDLGPASDLGTPSEDGTMLDGDPAGVPDPDEHKDGVILSTFHRAKGLQWPCVFVIGLSEGLVPIGSARSSVALAEEQRLLYVAMTRAEEELWCSWAFERDEGGGVRRKPSRWLGAIEREKAAFQAEQGPADPSSVLTHLSHIRSVMSRPAEPAPGDPAVRQNRPAPR
jgi:DNA helicase-2/ATP-dependent DNA helicase PcrA